jgi:hypothetical protein
VEQVVVEAEVMDLEIQEVQALRFLVVLPVVNLMVNHLPLAHIHHHIHMLLEEVLPTEVLQDLGGLDQEEQIIHQPILVMAEAEVEVAQTAV